MDESARGPLRAREKRVLGHVPKTSANPSRFAIGSQLVLCYNTDYQHTVLAAAVKSITRRKRNRIHEQVMS